MRTRSIPSWHRGSWLATFAAIVAAVVVLTGSTAASHGHAAGADGRHDISHHGTIVHDDSLGTCSICKLAHETSSGPVTPDIVSVPLFAVAPKAHNGPALLVSALPSFQQPRAPPCLVSC